MGIFGRKQAKSNGFTIVELVIVIVVIGILAGIVAFTVPGYQKRSRDNQRKSDVTQIAAAFNAYALQKNGFMEAGSGCGWQGNGNGWFDAGPNAFFPKSLLTCLKDTGVLKKDITDPSLCVSDSGGACGAYDGSPTPAYMKATCEKNGSPITYIFAYLETQPANAAAIDALCDAGTVDGFDSNTQKWGTHYGMNYYVVVK